MNYLCLKFYCEQMTGLSFDHTPNTRAPVLRVMTLVMLMTMTSLLGQVAADDMDSFVNGGRQSILFKR